MRRNGFRVPMPLLVVLQQLFRGFGGRARVFGWVLGLYAAYVCDPTIVVRWISTIWQHVNRNDDVVSFNLVWLALKLAKFLPIKVLSPRVKNHKFLLMMMVNTATAAATASAAPTTSGLGIKLMKGLQTKTKLPKTAQNSSRWFKAGWQNQGYAWYIVPRTYTEKVGLIDWRDTFLIFFLMWEKRKKNCRIKNLK